MNFDVLQFLERRWKTLAVSAAILMVAAAGLSFVRPLEYSATARLLVIQKSGQNQDPYAAIRATDSLTNNLSKVIYTTDFFDKVMVSGYKINRDYFSQNEYDRRKQWARMVSAQATYESGFLQITVYHPDKEQASEIAQAVVYTLKTEGWQYLGASSALDIRLVDPPLLSRYPVRPNVLLNAFLGAVIGLVLSSLYLVIGESRRRVAIHGGPY